MGLRTKYPLSLEFSSNICCVRTWEGYKLHLPEILLEECDRLVSHNSQKAC